MSQKTKETIYAIIISLGIIALSFIGDDAHAEGNIRIRLGGKKKSHTRCEWRSDLRRTRRNVAIQIGAMAVTFIGFGIISDNN